MTQTKPEQPAEASSAGLEGVVAGNSSLSRVDGRKGRLYYCGIPVEPLAEQATFEECVYLLWHQELPDRGELKSFKAELSALRVVPAETWEVLRPLSKSQSLMDLLRTGVSAMSAFDPDMAALERRATRVDAEARIARRLFARTATVVTGAWRLKQGLSPIEPRDDLSHAGNFLYMLDGKSPGEYEERIFDASLTLHADHGFNASTFAARVTAATESDVYAAITSAVGTLAGRLHGGANMRVMRMLEEIGDIANVESHVDGILGRPRGRVMGFGHRVYKVEDPRATVLRRMARELTERTGNAKWFKMSRAIEMYIKERKNINPNVDFYSASVYGSLNLAPEIFTPIFAVSRVSGWLAHVLEQHADNRLIRPRANYVGPELGRPFIPMDQR